jgi:quinol-cytochrome oxidoreductase complex cytochrome b subunit
VIDLSGAQHVIEFGWFRITYANLAVLALMVVAFVVAVAAPFPRGRTVDPETESEPITDDHGGGWTGTTRRWVRREFPWSRLLPSSEPAYVSSWTYTFGVATLASLAVIIASGIVLAVAGPGWRHTSASGRFVDATHLWSVQLFFFFMILHLVAQFLQASWRGRRGPTWVIGSVALLASILTALTGYVSQQNFEAQWIATQAKDGFNAVGIGAFLNLLNTQQVLTLHVLVLPLTVAAVVGIHILLVRRRGVCPPIGSEMPTGDDVALEQEEVAV